MYIKKKYISIYISCLVPIIQAFVCNNKSVYCIQIRKTLSMAWQPYHPEAIYYKQPWATVGECRGVGVRECRRAREGRRQYLVHLRLGEGARAQVERAREHDAQHVLGRVALQQVGEQAEGRRQARQRRRRAALRQPCAKHSLPY